MLGRARQFERAVFKWANGTRQEKPEVAGEFDLKYTGDPSAAQRRILMEIEARKESQCKLLESIRN